MSMSRKSVLALGCTIFVAAASPAAAALADPAARKAAVKCQKTIGQVNAKILTSKLKALEACGEVLLACVQTKQNADDCVPKAAKKCAKLDDFTRLVDKARLKVVGTKSCATDLTLAEVLGADGLGLGQIAARCLAERGRDVCTGLDAVAACLVGSHERVAGALYGETHPRMAELLDLLAVRPTVDGLPRYPGCGDCPGALESGKAIEQCAEAFASTTRNLVGRLEGALRTCAGSVFTCVTEKPDTPRCLPKAKAGCDKAAGKIDLLIAKLAQTVAKKCGGSADFARVAATSGVNFEALADRCSVLAPAASSTMESITACLRARARCGVAELVRQTVPPTDDFVGGGRLGRLEPYFTATCPTPGVASVVNGPVERAGVFGSLTRIVKQIRRPRAGVNGTPYTRSPPVPSSGAGRRVTRISGPPRIPPGATTRVPFRYRRAATRAVATEDPPTLVLALQGEGVGDPSFFEIALDPTAPVETDIEDELELTYEEGFPGCAFTLLFATRDGAEVSDYTPLLQVVDDAIEPTPVATPTRTSTPAGTGTPSIKPTPVCALPASGQKDRYLADKNDGIGGQVEVPDDGILEAGATLNFIDNGDGTITDLNTGLMWEKKGDDDSLHDRDNRFVWSGDGTEETIWDWLDDINAAPGFAGYSDWRIPNIRELATLVDYGRSFPEPAMHPVFDNGCITGCSVLNCSCSQGSFDDWSSTTSRSIPTSAWYLSSSALLATASKSAGGFVRAVRAGGCLAKSGQIVSFSADKNDGNPTPVAVPDDGELEVGVPISYVDNGNGTITDLNTGLSWEKKGDDGSLHDQDNGYVWSGVGPEETIWDWLDELNAVAFAGHTDWRIPNIRELETLADYGRLSSIDPVFDTSCQPDCPVETCSCPSSGSMWSSTTDDSSVTSAWLFYGDDGSTTTFGKTVSALMRAVRGGQP